MKINSERHQQNPMPSISRDYSLTKQKSVNNTSDNYHHPTATPKVNMDSDKKNIYSQRTNIYSKKIEDSKSHKIESDKRLGASAYDGSFKLDTFKSKIPSSNNLATSYGKISTKNNMVNMNTFNKRENKYDFTNL